MTRGLTAGFAYFAAVFAIGFALGTLRALVLAPIVSPLTAVLIELPVMLSLSWMVCGWLLRRFSVPRAVIARAAMGGTAFALLIAAEYAVSALLFGRSLSEHLAHYVNAEGVLGLAAQLVFAAFPLVRSRHARSGSVSSLPSRHAGAPFPAIGHKQEPS